MNPSPIVKQINICEEPEIDVKRVQEVLKQIHQLKT